MHVTSTNIYLVYIKLKVYALGWYIHNLNVLQVHSLNPFN